MESKPAIDGQGVGRRGLAPAFEKWGEKKGKKKGGESGQP